MIAYPYTRINGKWPWEYGTPVVTILVIAGVMPGLSAYVTSTTVRLK